MLIRGLAGSFVVANPTKLPRNYTKARRHARLADINCHGATLIATELHRFAAIAGATAARPRYGWTVDLASCQVNTEGYQIATRKLCLTFS